MPSNRALLNSDVQRRTMPFRCFSTIATKRCRHITNYRKYIANTAIMVLQKSDKLAQIFIPFARSCKQHWAFIALHICKYNSISLSTLAGCLVQGNGVYRRQIKTL